MLYSAEKESNNSNVIFFLSRFLVILKYPLPTGIGYVLLFIRHIFLLTIDALVSAKFNRISLIGIVEVIIIEFSSIIEIFLISLQTQSYI